MILPECYRDRWHEKTGFPGCQSRLLNDCNFCTIPACDGQMDGQTDIYQAVAYVAPCIRFAYASRRRSELTHTAESYAELPEVLSKVPRFLLHFVSSTYCRSACYFAKYCDERLCMSACMSVCSLACLKNGTSKLHEIFCTCRLCPGIGSPLTTMQYVMYFRFCGWTSCLPIKAKFHYASWFEAGSNQIA